MFNIEMDSLHAQDTSDPSQLCSDEHRIWMQRWQRVFIAMLQKGCYKQAEDLVRSGSLGASGGYDPFGASNVAYGYLKAMKDPISLRDFDSLINEVQDYGKKKPIDTILSRGQYPHSEMFREFLLAQAKHLHQRSWTYLHVSWLYLVVALVVHNSWHMSWCNHVKESSTHICKTLSVCVQAGLSTHEPFTDELSDAVLHRCPFTLCVTQNLYPEAVLLYQTGAVSNRELSLIASNEDVLVRPQTEVADFVSIVASKPRSLENLCCLKISGFLGIGPDRKKRAENLGLSPHLVKAVNFADATAQYEKVIASDEVRLRRESLDPVLLEDLFSLPI